MLKIKKKKKKHWGENDIPVAALFGALSGHLPAENTY